MKNSEHTNNFESNSNVAKAVEFYYTHLDSLDNSTYFEKLIDLSDEGIDMDFCRIYCKVGSHYSSSRFRQFVANWFGVTVEQMKLLKHFGASL